MKPASLIDIKSLIQRSSWSNYKRETLPSGATILIVPCKHVEALDCTQDINTKTYVYTDAMQWLPVIFCFDTRCSWPWLDPWKKLVWFDYVFSSLVSSWFTKVHPHGFTHRYDESPVAFAAYKWHGKLVVCVITQTFGLLPIESCLRQRHLVRPFYLTRYGITILRITPTNTANYGASGY